MLRARSDVVQHLVLVERLDYRLGGGAGDGIAGVGSSLVCEGVSVRAHVALRDGAAHHAAWCLLVRELLAACNARKRKSIGNTCVAKELAYIHV